MRVAIVAENMGVNGHRVDDRKRDDHEQQRYPLSGPEEEEQAEPGRDNERIAHKKREMQRIAKWLKPVRDIGTNPGRVETLRRFAVDMRRSRHLREPVKQL